MARRNRRLFARTIRRMSLENQGDFSVGGPDCCMVLNFVPIEWFDVSKELCLPTFAGFVDIFLLRKHVCPIFNKNASNLFFAILLMEKPLRSGNYWIRVLWNCIGDVWVEVGSTLYDHWKMIWPPNWCHHIHQGRGDKSAKICVLENWNVAMRFSPSPVLSLRIPTPEEGKDKAVETS